MRLDATMMTHLSFPDFDVLKVEFSPTHKTLTIFVEGAWLDIIGEGELGKGILFFEDWQNLTLHTFDMESEQMKICDSENFDPLKDICEMTSTISHVSLSGFSKNSGLWTEWHLQNATMHAEFEKLTP